MRVLDELNQEFRERLRHQHRHRGPRRRPTNWRRACSFSAPGVVDFSKEPEHVLELYGIGEKPTDDFGRQLLLARRLVENGVRFIQICHAGGGNGGWDAHGDMKTHEPLCRAVDKPIAGLIRDLKQRGMLIARWWSSAASSAAARGRRTRPAATTIRRATALVRRRRRQGRHGPRRHRRVGYKAVENRHYYSDLHATILNQLGLDYKKMEFRALGRTFHLWKKATGR